MAVVLYGVAQNDLARSLGGACLTMTALTLIALVSIRKWTSDTYSERNRLADATREADQEKMRLVAAAAAQEAEIQRIRRDAVAAREQLEARLTAERQAMHEQLEAERKAMREQLEVDRARITCEAMEAAFALLPGMLAEQKRSATRGGAVIGFPTQAHQRADSESSARDHGATRG
ncbi:hypothetical protein [Streptomyces sp. NPDC058603]|uniref:hypothetical protein n=1 Tax=Streptomyces sp. NPDC058603 TaxID=3346551 RepID=UPI0036613C18